MKRILLYSITLTTLFFSHSSFAQLSKHNISASGGFSYPYNPKSYNSIGRSVGFEYLLMVDPANGIAFQVDITRFKKNLFPTEFSTLSAGFRHAFTEKFYAQVSLGGGSCTGSIDSGGNFTGTAELRTGFYFPFQKRLGYDLSLLLKQTTKEFGWIGIRIAVTLSFRKKKTE